MVLKSNGLFQSQEEINNYRGPDGSIVQPFAKPGDIRYVDTNNDGRIDVKSFTGLLVDFAARENARLLIRGLRAVSDFEYEYQMALMNRHLSPRLETVYMVPSLDTTYISASLVREIARYGGDVSSMVHPAVAKALRERTGAP